MAKRKVLYANGYSFPSLQCKILRLEANYVLNEVTLHLADGHCCDMEGAIKLAKKVHPEVESIQTFSGPVPDTFYMKIGQRWTAWFKREEFDVKFATQAA